MSLKQVVKRLRAKLEISAHQLGKDLGVSHTAVIEWEHGKGPGAFNRIRLLAYAREKNAPPEIIEALESAQPQVLP